MKITGLRLESSKDGVEVLLAQEAELSIQQILGLDIGPMQLSLVSDGSHDTPPVETRGQRRSRRKGALGGLSLRGQPVGALYLRSLPSSGQPRLGMITYTSLLELMDFLIREWCDSPESARCSLGRLMARARREHPQDPKSQAMVLEESLQKEMNGSERPLFPLWKGEPKSFFHGSGFFHQMKLVELHLGGEIFRFVQAVECVVFVRPRRLSLGKIQVPMFDWLVCHCEEQSLLYINGEGAHPFSHVSQVPRAILKDFDRHGRVIQANEQGMVPRFDMKPIALLKCPSQAKQRALEEKTLSPPKDLPACYLLAPHQVPDLASAQLPVIEDPEAVVAVLQRSWEDVYNSAEPPRRFLGNWERGYLVCSLPHVALP